MAEMSRYCEAIMAEIRREMLIAKIQWGDDDLEIRMIEDSWGDTLDDRETLRMLRSVNGWHPRQDHLPDRHLIFRRENSQSRLHTGERGQQHTRRRKEPAGKHKWMHALPLK